MASSLVWHCPSSKSCLANTTQTIRIPLEEKPVFKGNSNSQLEGWILQCPYCHIPVLQCENCFRLIEDTTENISISSSSSQQSSFQSVVCRYCGFLNIIGSIRQILQLAPLKPVIWENVRVIQRCISGSQYLEMKTSILNISKNIIDNSDDLTSLNEKKHKSNSEKNEFLEKTLEWQIQQLQNPLILQRDLELVEKFTNLPKNGMSFLKTHFKLIQALYQQNFNEDQGIDPVFKFQFFQLLSNNFNFILDIVEKSRRICSKSSLSIKIKV